MPRPSSPIIRPVPTLAAGVLGLAAQGTALALWADLKGWAALLWILAPIVAAVCCWRLPSRHQRCGGGHLAIVAGLGGLAMLAGSWLEGGSELAHGAHRLPALWGWGTAAMLTVCVGDCVRLRRRGSSPPGVAGRWADLGGLAGMLTGMALGGLWLAPPLTATLGSELAAHHLAMVVGMTLGTAIGRPGPLLFASASAGRQPIARVAFYQARKERAK